MHVSISRLARKQRPALLLWVSWWGREQRVVEAGWRSGRMEGCVQQRSSYTESAGLWLEGASQANSERCPGTMETTGLSHTHECKPKHTHAACPSQFLPGGPGPVRHGVSEYLSAGKTACPRCCCHVCQRGGRERGWARERARAVDRQTDRQTTLCVEYPVPTRQHYASVCMLLVHWLLL